MLKPLTAVALGRNFYGGQGPVLTGIEGPLHCGAAAGEEVDVHGFARRCFGVEGEALGAGELDRRSCGKNSGVGLVHGRGAFIGHGQSAAAIAHLIQRMGHLGFGRDVLGVCCGVIGHIFFVVFQNGGHFSHFHRDGHGEAIVGNDDIPGSAGGFGSGEYAVLGDGTGVARHLPGEQVVLFIKNTGLGIGIDIQIDGFSHIHGQGGDGSAAFVLYHHPVGLLVNRDGGRHGSGGLMIQGDQVFSCLLRGCEHIALQDLLRGRGHPETGIVRGHRIIMLVKGVGPQGDLSAGQGGYAVRIDAKHRFLLQWEWRC